MNETGLATWIDALLNPPPNITQLRGSLRAGNAYCCLGVKLLTQGITLPRCTNSSDYYDRLEDFRDGHERAFFMWLNDDRLLTFAEIAMAASHLPRADWFRPGFGRLKQAIASDSRMTSF